MIYLKKDNFFPRRSAMSLSKGVFQAKKKDGSIYYRSSVTYRQKHISLGSFADENSANAAYREARRLLDCPEILFSPDYQPDVLSFEKYVMLMNFRDNHYYFTNPIYAYPRYFLYFLSREIIFKFDTDDLFYYASHKIMKRGGHYFVADYGMQVSIAGRYGIRPYAVLGKDYRFENNDPFDFRYENIIIINRYHGVRSVQKAGRTMYKAVIHIRSSYVVGTYPTETEAAIAYNKAADILTQNGFRRNFMQNYMEGMSPSIYASIYSRLPVSDTVKNLRPCDTDAHPV